MLRSKGPLGRSLPPRAERPGAKLVRGRAGDMGTVLSIVVMLAVLGAAAACLARLGRRERVRAVHKPGGYQVACITVRGRYRPEIVEVEEGVPLRLHFIRDEDDPCSERVVFSGVGVDRRLPPFQETTIEFVPREEGAFLFTCQRGMYRGTLVVKASRGARRSLSRNAARAGIGRREQPRAGPVGVADDAQGPAASSPLPGNRPGVPGRHDAGLPAGASTGGRGNQVARPGR